MNKLMITIAAALMAMAGGGQYGRLRARRESGLNTRGRRFCATGAMRRAHTRR